MTMKKNARKLITSLKKMDGEFAVSPLWNIDYELNTLIRVLREIIVTSMSIFKSLLSFLALPASKSKSVKWLRVAKLMHIYKRIISCEKNLETFNELQCVKTYL